MPGNDGSSAEGAPAAMEEAVIELTKQVQSKYYGKYRGFVVDNDDPEQMGRLRLQVPTVLGDAVTVWALPCLPAGGAKNMGFFIVPDVDAQVWVEFEEGNLNRPIWSGTFWQKKGEIPEEAALNPPTTSIFRTSGGHKLQFDDEADKEKITLFHSIEAEMVIDEKGSITIKDAQENTVTLDADGGEISIEDANGNSMIMTSTGTTIEDCNGNKIEMGASGITIKGQQIVLDGSMVMLAGQGGEGVIKGQSFLTLFATHMHPSAMGPTGPPVPQGEMSTLSMKTTTG